MDDGVVARPHVDDAEVGVGVEALGELFTLMEHVALEGVADLEPGEHFFFFDEFFASAFLEGVEMDEGFVRDHAGQGEADSGVFVFVVVAAVEVFVVFNGEDLLEEDKAVEDGCFETSGDGDDTGDTLGMAGGERDGEEPADRGADGGVELIDAEMIEKGDLSLNEIRDIEVREGGAEGLAGFGIDTGGA